jgi:hypothetical protein
MDFQGYGPSKKRKTTEGVISTLQESYDVSTTPQIIGNIAVQGDVVCQAMDASGISMDAAVNATLSIRRDGAFKWRMQNSSSLGDSLVFENAGSQDILSLNQSGNVIFGNGNNNNYTFPISRGTADQFLQSNGDGVLTWRTDHNLGGRYVQASVDEIVTITNSTVETSLSNSGVGSMSIDEALDSSLNDTYRITIQGFLRTEEKDEEAILRVRDSSGYELFRHTMSIDDTKTVSPSSGELFTYSMTIQRFSNLVIGPYWLRFFGTMAYAEGGDKVRRHQSGTSVTVGEYADQIDLDVTWQFLNNPATFISVSSLVFERIF